MAPSAALTSSSIESAYICPGEKLLHTTGTVIDGGTLRYRASKIDCDVCAFKMRCCPSTPTRYVPRDLHEDARDVARALAKTEAYEQSRRERNRNRSEPAAPRQVPLPPAAIGTSSLPQ
jgi:hypothetical protein